MELSDEDLGVSNSPAASAPEPAPAAVPEPQPAPAPEPVTTPEPAALSDADVGLLSDADLGIEGKPATPKQEPWSTVQPGVANQAIGMATDIPQQVYRAGSEAIQQINQGLNPFTTAARESLEKQSKKPFWDFGEELNRLSRVGSGLMGIGNLAAAPITGLGRSVIGHGWEAMKGALPEISEEKKAKLRAAGIDPEGPSGEEVADKAMMAMRPKGAPAKAPAAPGMKPEWTYTPENAVKAPTPPPGPNGPLGVTLSEGQATGDLPAIKREQAASRAQAETSPYEHASAFNEQQGQQVAAAKEKVGQGLDQTGTGALVESPHEAADTISSALANQERLTTAAKARADAALKGAQNALREEVHPDHTVAAQSPLDAAEVVSASVAREAEKAEEAIKGAYGALKELPGQFHPATFNPVESVIKHKLNSGSDPVRVSPETTPQASHALADLSEVLSDVKQLRDPETGRVVKRPPITPEALDNARKRLNTFYGDALSAARSSNNWSDVRAMRRVMNAFDDFVAQKLKTNYIGGDPAEVSKAFDTARGLYSNYRKTYTSQGAGDTVGSQVQKIIGRFEDQEATPEQITKMLYGTGGQQVPIAKRLIDIFGKESPEIGTIKQGFLSHIMEAPAGGGAWDWGKIANRIEGFTRGNGRTLLQTYFSPDEINKLRQLQSWAKAYDAHANKPLDPLEKIAGQLTGLEAGVTPSSQSNVDLLFRRALSGDRNSIGLAEKLRSQFGATSPEFSAYKQGLFRTAIERGPGLEEDWGHKRTGDNLSKLINSELGKKVYSAPERELMQQYVELQRKLTVPQSGAQWSNHPGYVSKATQVVVGAVAAIITNMLSHGALMGLPEFAAGMTSGAAARGVESAMKLRQIRKQMPLITEATERYNKALAAYNKKITPMSTAAVSTATVNLIHSVKPFGIQLPPGLLQLPGTPGAQEKPEEKRAAGGMVEPTEDSITADFARQAAAERLRKSVTHRAEGGEVAADDLPAGFGNEGFEPQFSQAPERGAVDKLFGLTGPRYQTWPERLVRSGFTAPGEAYQTGQLATHDEYGHETGRETLGRPGLRREDVTDIPAPGWGEGNFGLKPSHWEPGDAAVERAQDTAGMAGGASFGAVTPAKAATSVLADSAKTGAPLAAIAQQSKPFYSVMERAVESAKLEKGTPEQWRGYLQNQPGVKKEELDWIGLPEGKQLTRQDVADWVKSHGAELKEVGKRDVAGRAEEIDAAIREAYVRNDADLEQVNQLAAKIRDGDRSPELAQTYADAYNRQARSMQELSRLQNEAAQVTRREGTQYHKYQLPGGENYREMLLSLPEKQTPLQKRVAAEGSGGLTDAERAQFRKDNAATPQPFHSSHWVGEPNVLLHMRMNDRIIPNPAPEKYTKLPEEFTTSSAANGNGFVVHKAGEPPTQSIAWGQSKTAAEKEAVDLLNTQPNWTKHRTDGLRSLHLEEIQSDWHQKGRRSGYAQPRDASEFEPHWNEEAGQWEVLDKKTGKTHDVDPFNVMPDDPDAASKAARVVASRLGQQGVPDAPFKSTWADLGLKRAIAKAAHEGYDALSWTPGEAQAARYDLSKQVDRIAYNPETGTLAAFKGSLPIIERRGVKPDQLPDLIGKDAAERILNDPTRKGKISNSVNFEGEHNILEGDDLKVGGEGMKAFYDKMLVDKANALAKKHGAKVEQHRLGIGEKGNPLRKDAAGNISGGIHAHVLRLTPELKAAAMKGFPLFADSGKVGAPLSGLTRRPAETLQRSSELWEDYDYANAIKAASKGEAPKVGQTTTGGWKLTPEHVQEIQQAAKDLQEAASSGTIKSHFGVWRAMHLPEGSDLTKLYPRNKVVDFNGLTAVAKDRSIAEKYLDPQFVGDEPSVPVLFNIQRRGGVVGFDRPDTDFPDSVLPHGSRYRVVSRTQAPDGTPVVTLYDKGDLNGHFLLKSNEHQKQHDVRGPVGEEPDDHQQPVLHRAHGGRVVAHNINHNPTEAQKASGNYAKDHVHIHGLPITVENAKGSKRSGIGPDGKRWEAVLPAHYGYIKGTKGADKDHLDVYLGPHTKSPYVFVIDQKDARTGRFDEHKIGLGFGSQRQFVETYKRAFSDGKGLARIGAVHTLTLSELKEALKRHDWKKPYKTATLH